LLRAYLLLNLLPVVAQHYFTSSKITTTENQYLTFLWYKNEDNLDYFLLIISNQKIFYPAS